MDRQGPLAAVRKAVDEFARTYRAVDDRWCVALSGGADSLALVAAAAPWRPTIALIVDHGLQPGSAAVARTARDQALSLGCVDAQILRVEVGGRVARRRRQGRLATPLWTARATVRR